MSVLSIALSGMIISSFLLIRNEMVNQHTRRAINYIYKQTNWQELRKKHNADNNYNATKNLFDLTKWTYNKMFPGL